MKSLQVIFSDSNRPGEGEHKIMNYIRTLRGNPNYNPNTRHCVYGLDGDLFLLALVTHEPHFVVLREEVLFGEEQMYVCVCVCAFVCVWVIYAS